MLLVSRSTLLLPASSKAARTVARLIRNTRALFDSLSVSSSEPIASVGANTADCASEVMKGAQSSAALAGERTEPRVSAGGFVASASTAVPLADPDISPGPVVGINTTIMGDMVDALLSAFRGDHQRVAADVADMARCQSIYVRTTAGSSVIKPPLRGGTTTQDWPRGSITDPAAVRRQPNSK